MTARPDGTVSLFLGDVTGHGDAVADDAVRLGRVFRALTTEGHDSQVIMSAARRSATRLGTTATALYGEIDTAEGWLSVCCAGHPAPILLRRMSAEPLPTDSAPPLGTGWTREEDWSCTRLVPGDALLVYSDGLADASGSMTEQLGSMLAEAHARGAGLHQLCDLALEAAAESSDDRSVLAIGVSEELVTPGVRHTSSPDSHGVAAWTDHTYLGSH